mgnify:CR=1 FL=1
MSQKSVTIPTITQYSGTIPDKATQTEEEFANIKAAEQEL